MPGRSGQRDCPADVTAVAKMQANRARGVVAGVVSGADVDASVFQRPHPDESASSRIRPSLNTEDPSFWGILRSAASARQWKPRVRAYGWCRAQMHTRKKRRMNPSQWPRGRMEQSSIRPLGLRMSATIGLTREGFQKSHEPTLSNMVLTEELAKDFRERNRYRLRYCQGRNTARGRCATCAQLLRLPFRFCDWLCLDAARREVVCGECAAEAPPGAPGSAGLPHLGFRALREVAPAKRRPTISLLLGFGSSAPLTPRGPTTG